MRTKQTNNRLKKMTNSDSFAPLFETKKGKGSLIYKIFAASQFVGIVFIWVYRGIHLKEDGGIWWLGIFGAELWFGFYWILTQSLRWNRVYRHTFKDRLSLRYEDDLPGVDIFVCTADPTIEPPMMVINTVLSVMAYDYPPDKLSVYLSDDAGSDITFYALVEASRFAKHWIPYCKRFKVEPRSPEAHFLSTSDELIDEDQAEYISSVKKLYQEMENRIEVAKKLGRISKNAVMVHKGFSKWDSFISHGDHEAILQILIDGRDSKAMDIEGRRLPTLVYLAREKRPHHFHNFKAGAMNALIRVSSEISNGPIILNVDCDMYSNNSKSIRDVLCFFLDEEKGHEVAFVQFPQNFHNITKNELYGDSIRVIAEVEFHGLDGFGGPLYVGTGCFHRRDTLSGRKFSEESRFNWKENNVPRTGESVDELEERIKEVAGCTFEKNTQWGIEMGLKYGVPVEDVITGLSIQCRGWKSIYFNPEQRAFLGVAATTLDQALVQHKRWSEGDLQILLSKHSPLFGLGRISIGLVMGYCTYCLWAVNCFATLYYSSIPSLFLLRGIPLFPKVSSLWLLPFAYVLVSEYIYSFLEFLLSGGTALGWWNEQRMWLYKRTSSYLFAVFDTLLKLLGYRDSGFIISAKVSDDDVLQRYRQEKMEFGSTSPMFTILSSLAMLNLFCFIGKFTEVVIWSGKFEVFLKTMALQILLSGVLVLINLPLYNAAFFREDKGRMPSSVTLTSFLLSFLLCSCFYGFM